MKLSLSPDIGRVLLATWLSVKIGGAFLMGRLIHRPLTTEELARRIRIALERLGGTYIKLGQFVAMRFDLVPRDVARELEKLFDTAPALPLADVLRVVEEELGRPA